MARRPPEEGRPWKLADHPCLGKGKVLDGWGEAASDPFNCIHVLKKDHLKMTDNNVCQVTDQMVKWRSAKLVDLALASGKIYEGEGVGVKYIQQSFENGTLHLIGLLSDGGVHSRIDQLHGGLGKIDDCPFSIEVWEYIDDCPFSTEVWTRFRT